MSTDTYTPDPSWFGWEDRPDDVKPIRQIYQVSRGSIMTDLSIKPDSPMLHNIFQQIAGVEAGLPGYQKIGDCVSWGWALALTVLRALASRIFDKFVATEPIYGGSRVEIGGGRIGGDGSIGAWAGDFVNRYGLLFRDVYGQVDLTQYDPNRAKSWGRSGVPDQIEPDAKQFICKTIIPIQSADECARVITDMGLPVPVCSNQGFANRRDEYGFARAQGMWPHCMCILAYRDDRKGFLINNSWPKDWISGPKAFDQPDGSFWAEWSVVDRMLKGGDSFAPSDAQGLKSRDFDWVMF